MATIPLTVPEAVHASYLVPVGVGEIDADPAELLDRALDAPVADRRQAAVVEATRALFERGLLVVESSGPSVDLEPLLDVLAVFGASADDLRALASAPGSLLVNLPGPLLPGDPLHELTARTAASRLATLLGSVGAVDLSTPRLLPPEDLLPYRSTDPRFAITVADLVLVPQSPGERGRWLTTKGLSRWGLPELQVIDVPPPAGTVWTSILTGIAAELIRRFTETVDQQTVDGVAPAIVEIDDRLVVTTEVMAEAYGSEVGDQPVGRAEVQFTFDPSPDPDADDFLTVRAPDDFGRSAGEFHLDVVQALFGSDQGEVREVGRDDEGLAAATETARSCLSVARARFLAGELQHERLLIVKYRLETDGEVELPWLFVTDWAEDGRIHGSSAVDAEHDPTVRVGRPVVTTVDQIDDWGIWVDGEGIVEGGWTNAYLQGEPPPPVPTSSAGDRLAGDRAAGGERSARRRWWRRGG